MSKDILSAPSSKNFEGGDKMKVKYISIIIVALIMTSIVTFSLIGCKGTAVTTETTAETTTVTTAAPTETTAAPTS